MVNELERQVINLVATDRLYVPSSSFDGKLERRRPKIAKDLGLISRGFQGERTYVRIQNRDKNKARGLRNGIDKFAEEFPKYGEILNGMIEEQRTVSEKHLYFGVQDGKRLTNDDYMNVLTGMGLGPVTAQKYCDVALDISRKMQQERERKGKPEAERSILIG